MNESKKKVCKYPKCQKEIPGEKGLFCSHHKKSVKEKGKAVGTGTAAVVGTLGVILLTAISIED
ncbi:hypothetical protein DOK76_00230 [Vagococcus sp. DIV0080]|uniref:AN1-type domain-containing protein n=1 Tax=Candidatus Vagococcus giribetii TaxID=2230876 RepID=A0ABS3HP01_9ENTE|nr:hypothetical protein [Vagococcus sp. DIV0080]MBO0475471.1 hypothetical protein [Vagococcus sp. DIV0080]